MPRSLLVVIVAVSIVAVGVVAGCSSSYMPQARGKVGIILKDGKPAYVRDGQVYEHGVLGGGLVEAVQGNPRAEQAAHEYRSRMGTGILIGIGGLVCMTVTTAVGISRLDLGPGTTSNSHDGEAYLLGALACGVAGMVGFGYAITAEPYRWDAINMFNDDAERQLQQLQGYPPGWSAARKKQSLKMGD
jgi:hypothetical protein